MNLEQFTAIVNAQTAKGGLTASVAAFGITDLTDGTLDEMKAEAIRLYEELLSKEAEVSGAADNKADVTNDFNNDVEALDLVQEDSDTLDQYEKQWDMKGQVVKVKELYTATRDDVDNIRLVVNYGKNSKGEVVESSHVLSMKQTGFTIPNLSRLKSDKPVIATVTVGKLKEPTPLMKWNEYEGNYTDTGKTTKTVIVEVTFDHSEAATALFGSRGKKQFVKRKRQMQQNFNNQQDQQAAPTIATRDYSGA